MGNSPIGERLAGRSPRLAEARTHPGPAETGVIHTPAELRRLLAIAHARGARSVTIGHARTAAARSAATAFGHAWTAGGAEVLDIVDWPERAASWLRQARRFTARRPGLWVMAGDPAGWAQMVRRLLWSTDWTPANTIGFASLADPRAVELAGAGDLDGLTGATPAGDTWIVVDHRIRIVAGTGGR
jgi:hypothetical protein